MNESASASRSRSPVTSASARARQGQHQEWLVERIAARGNRWRRGRDGDRFTPRQIIGQQIVAVGRGQGMTAIYRVVDAILLKQSDEWAAPRRYNPLGNLAPPDDNATFRRFVAPT